MELSLAGRHALVCGASMGIGRASARALAALGADITALARSSEKLEELITVLHDAGARKVRFVVVDLDERAAFKEALTAFLESHGPVHILVNNSGGPPPGPLLEAGEEDLLKAFGRHVLCSHWLVKTLLPGMTEAGYGRIINVISTSVREPIPNLGVSNTIRGAMASWSKTLSRELPPGVTINNILPGYTATERLGQIADFLASKSGRSRSEVEHEWSTKVPEGRLARPDEVARVIAFLASPAASYIRGINLPVDGGRLQGI